MSPSHANERLRRWFQAGFAAADPSERVSDAIEWQGDRLAIAGEPVGASSRVFLLALGKAAAPMAAAAEQKLAARLFKGLVVTKEGHSVPLLRCSLHEGAHPVPDARSDAAGQAALQFVRQVGSQDTLLVLLSGGASSLLASPLPGLSLRDVSQTTAALLGSGAPIDEFNAVRKRLVATAGGRLARECPASQIHVLVVSDVPGDSIEVIGSGPFALDGSSFADAWAVLVKRDLLDVVPSSVRQHLESGFRAMGSGTPPPSSPAVDRVRHHLVASNLTALSGVEAAIRADGVVPIRVTSELVGEAREVGRRFAALARSTSQSGLCLTAGGETTVTLRGAGRGGRSQELALAAALGMEHVPASLLAAGTDGTDGPTDAAGAIIDGETVARSRAQGVEGQEFLDRNDSYGFFSRVGGHVVTGPTGTNVMDLVLLDLVGESS